MQGLTARQARLWTRGAHYSVHLESERLCIALHFPLMCGTCRTSGPDHINPMMILISLCDLLIFSALVSGKSDCFIGKLVQLYVDVVICYTTCNYVVG